MTSLQTINIQHVSFNMVQCSNLWMGETQVTQELWQAVMGWNPSYFKGINLPVERVTWYDCLVFCNRLSKMKGYSQCYELSNYITSYEDDHLSLRSATVKWYPKANGFRLPTEAEWEYCANAGTTLTYSSSNNIDDIAWYYNNSKVNGIYTTHEVKTKKANGWGLYDMSGNVWEWCMDQWNENTYQIRSNRMENPILWENSPCARVVRGGSCRYYADNCRVASRHRYVADIRYDDQGFRLLRCEP